MAKPTARDDKTLENLQDLGRFRQIGTATSAARRQRSKRGLTSANSINCCFRLETERRKKIDLHLVEQDIEFGEFMEELLRKAGF